MRRSDRVCVSKSRLYTLLSGSEADVEGNRSENRHQSLVEPIPRVAARRSAPLLARSPYSTSVLCGQLIISPPVPSRIWTWRRRPRAWGGTRAAPSFFFHIAFSTGLLSRAIGSTGHGALRLPAAAAPGIKLHITRARCARSPGRRVRPLRRDSRSPVRQSMTIQACPVEAGPVRLHQIGAPGLVPRTVALRCPGRENRLR